MKKIFLLAGLLMILMPPGIQAQQQRLMTTWVQSAEGEIDLANDRLEMNALSATILQKGNPPNEDYQIFAGLNDISLEDGELVLRYQLPGSSLYPWATFYRADLKVYFNDTPLEPAPAAEYLIGAGRLLRAGASPRIILSHLLPQYVQLQGRLRLELTVEALIDCDLLMADSPPAAFPKRPYYIAAGAGAGMLVAGGFLWADAQPVYDDYLDAGDAETAEPIYEKANGRRHASLILLFGGAAVLTGDVIAYFVRKGKLNRQQREKFQQLCLSPSPGLTLTPDLGLPSPAGPNGSLGFKLTYAWGN